MQGIVSCKKARESPTSNFQRFQAQTPSNRRRKNHIVNRQKKPEAKSKTKNIFNLNRTISNPKLWNKRNSQQSRRSPLFFLSIFLIALCFLLLLLPHLHSHPQLHDLLNLFENRKRSPNPPIPTLRHSISWGEILVVCAS